MVEVPEAVLEELAGPVAEAIPLVVARIPATPAAELGRLRAAADDTWRIRGMTGRPGADFYSGVRPGPSGSPVRDALASLPPLLTERLLGALELTVPELDLADAPDLAGFLGGPPTGGIGMMTMGGMSEAVTASAMLDHIRPGAVPLVAALVRRLATVPRVAALLAVGPEVTDEEGVAAAHGAARLALAVSTTAAVLHRAGIHPRVAGPPAVLGVAIGTAVLLLNETPMPPGYAAAILDKVREEYLMPVTVSGSPPVSGHRFALLEEGDVPEEADFSGNGLVAVVPGGALIRTGRENGRVWMLAHVLEEPPQEVATGWEEVVEVSWHAATGGASVTGAQEVEPQLRRFTPPWPGDYRLRVHARGRDDADSRESYDLWIWQAPAAAEIVHTRTDRLGHRLRGEPEPVRPEPPEAVYRWLDDSTLSVAATVTVVTGAEATDVLRAFGADPAQPESLQGIADDLMNRRSIDPWVAVLDVGGAVIAVEYNGFCGSHTPVLERASATGRAASMYWNVNALTRLSFAEHGEVLLSDEPFGDLDAPPQLALLLSDLDFSDLDRRREAQGLLAVQRFTGHGITAEDLARIEAADIAFRIVPDLPTLYPHWRSIDNALGSDAEALTGLPEPALRGLAWWAAAEAARYADLDEDPDIVASINARSLTPEAHLRARRSQLGDHEHRWLWFALHHATNPDPTSAAAGAINAARYAAGPHAANLITDAKARITTLTTP
ncbi:DUF6461 domain-containing protein [Actinomadura sp. 6K520]|uniref:DUF6461 domain-containing protein n=1 Tax=Actinomadura sp. 6K520 TaxID=2530364 RepID=UPI00104882ED|nr:DUF6461 domain-containing protein [Actinomadura sp. 6K520]TDE22819.1 hypothetical protein E1289_29485 [Actinomadura sp. 6K520]